MKKSRIHMSPRARKVTYPLLLVLFVTFFSFIYHSAVLGGSAFPGGGRIVAGRYLLEEHGKTIELTATQYWLSFAHGVAVVLLFAGVFITVIVFHYTGDLRDDRLG